MTTRKRRTAQDVVQDAEHVLAKLAMARAQTVLKKVEKGRKKKLLEPAVVTAQKKALADLKHRLGGQKTIAAKKKAATGAEGKARAALWGAIRPVTEAVLLTPGLSEQNAVAFGRGRKVWSNSTPSMLGHAGAVLDASAGTAGKAALRDAGIAPAQVKSLTKLRDALATANTADSTTRGTGREASRETAALLKAVAAGTARIRKVVAHVLRDQPALLAQFAPTVSRYTPKAKQPQPAPAATSPG